jgi:hypothetical protein
MSKVEALHLEPVLEFVPEWMGDSPELILKALQMLAEEYPTNNGGGPGRTLTIDEQSGRVTIQQHNKKPLEVMVASNKTNPELALSYLNLLYRELDIITSVEKMRISSVLGIPLLMPPLKRLHKTPPPTFQRPLKRERSEVQKIEKPVQASKAPLLVADDTQKVIVRPEQKREAVSVPCDPHVIEQVEIYRKSKKLIDPQIDLYSWIMNINQTPNVVMRMISQQPFFREIPPILDAGKMKVSPDVFARWPKIIVPEAYDQYGIGIKRPFVLLVMGFPRHMPQGELQSIREVWEREHIGYFYDIFDYSHGNTVGLRFVEEGI